MTDTVTVLIGTTKGAFLLSGGSDRSGWQVSGPHCDGWPINHILGDPDTGTLWAAGGGDWHGAGDWRSEDGGESWDLSKLSSGLMDAWAANDPDFAAMIGWDATPAPFGGDLHSVWSLHHAHGVLYAGVKPGTLLESRDGGQSWTRNEGFANHPTRDTWTPGAAGLTVHSIVSHPTDPSALWLGISAAGVFASEDGGNSWDRRNRLSNAESCGDHTHPAAPRDGQTGHCVHNMQRASDGTLYQQNHHGVFRSRDAGRSWDDITQGLPSTFGFPIAVNPTNPAMIWTIPLNGDSAGRFPPDAAAAVWRSTDAGESWQAMRAGLPQTACFFTVLRQSMATEQAAQPGVYFGTNTGSVFASFDEGETWQEIARHLPTVLGLEVLHPA